jgi:TetR/AcrR family transcriptional regulator
MSTAVALEPTGAKAERTRAAILAAAEDLFSKRGFAATRLEDVAEAVQLTRAALFYYYRDKQTLYDAVVNDAFGSMAKRLEEVFDDTSKTLVQRLDLATEAWVDAIVARPTLARLILRIVADGADQPALHAITDNNITLKAWNLVAEGRKRGEFKPVHDDPFHAAAALIGTTIFYVAALAPLVPQGLFNPLDPKQVAAHKREAVRTSRRLLGITDNDN